MSPFGNDPPAGARQRRRGGRARGAIVVLAAVGALLAGCTASGGAGGDHPPTPATSAGPVVVDPLAWVRSAGTALTSGALTVTVATGAAPTAAAPADGTTQTATALAGPPLTVVPQDDGISTATAQVPAGTPTPVVVATLAAPDTATFDVQSDGSVLVRDAAGAILGGLGVVAGTVDGASAGLAGLAAAGDGLLTLTLTTRAGDADLPATSVTVRLATVAVDRVEWTDREDEGGRSLAVFPSAWGRTGQLAAVEAGWAQVVALAPDADTTGMHDQFVCHTIGAPDKESWNLEPWRPEVGSLATLLARCNP
ncbi:hypothetical protein AGMMS50218_08350 [Actinomycetota bacterium]|nr:hypothetical protein AGMMS50218_08350 [Actinomycetota bacterium]